MFTVPAPHQAGFVFALTALATLLMASNRVRYDMIALLVVLGLMLGGVLSVPEALSGFGNPVVILIAGLLVVGEMLDRTGVARLVGDWILRRGGGGETSLLVMLMLSSALLSAIMSSTAVVAIFIPIVLRIARQTGLGASRLLLPMSFAALVSGMLTLIATPPNLVISEELEYAGHAPLGMFSFSLLGVVVLALTLAYVILVARRLLPEGDEGPGGEPWGRRLEALWHDYRAEREIRVLELRGESPLCGASVADAGLDAGCGVRILTVLRGQGNAVELHADPGPGFTLRAGDRLVAAGPPAGLDRAMAERRLAAASLSDGERQRWNWEQGSVSVLLHPSSRLIGQSIREAGFRSRYGLDVVGLRRNHAAVAEFEDTPLAASDSLLVSGAWSKIRTLQAQNHDFVVLEVPREAAEFVPAYRRMSLALVLTAAMVAAIIFNWVPLVAAVLITAIAGVALRCLSAADAYRAIHWSSLVLLAGMLPLAHALQKTGGTELIVEGMVALVGDAGPGVFMSVLFFVTVLLTNILSNTTAAVLMAPIALGVAESLGISPYPLALTVLMAASSAFLTPVASPVVTLVVEPGGYRFADFLKLGAPMVLLVYAVTLVLVPLLFPW